MKNIKPEANVGELNVAMIKMQEGPSDPLLKSFLEQEEDINGVSTAWGSHFWWKTGLEKALQRGPGRDVHLVRGTASPLWAC